jgi:hypothetical protein
MADFNTQPQLPFKEDSRPIQQWDKDATKRTLDELFTYARQYRSSAEYLELLDFVSRFRFYSPYNAMLVHNQMPGAKFVAPANKWVRNYGRTIKPNAHSIVILQPMGPIMFVFDVSDTEGGPQSRPLPQEVEEPFNTRQGEIWGELDQTIENSKRDGIRIWTSKEGSQSAGSIQIAGNGRGTLSFFAGKDKRGEPIYLLIPIRYELLVNENLNKESRYATIAHELAHLYCGHLGTPNQKWWPERQGIDPNTCEFEAESISYLVCERLGIKNPSAEYLSGYMGKYQEVPDISIDLVMKVAGLIEKMGQERLKPRKENE